MKQRILFFTAMSAAAICASACSMEKIDTVDDVHAADEGQRVDFTVGISGSASKATSSEINSTKINSLQVFVFRDDILDAYASSDSSSTVTLSCTSGERSVYALVNATNVNGAGIKSKSDLLGRISHLEDNKADSFEMIGNEDVLLPHTPSVVINVKRIAARVKIKKISVDFLASAFDFVPITINEIFLENVAGDINYGLTSEPVKWYNKQGYSLNLPEFTHDDTNLTINSKNSSMVDYVYYAYPNKSFDSTDDEWSPRRTRLVLKATIEGSIFYYPITLPVLEANKSYEIENITITRLGSSNPDKPVAHSDCNFQCVVAPWDVVLVEDGVTM